MDCHACHVSTQVLECRLDNESPAFLEFLPLACSPDATLRSRAVSVLCRYVACVGRHVTHWADDTTDSVQADAPRSLGLFTPCGCCALPAAHSSSGIRWSKAWARGSRSARCSPSTTHGCP
jgi:hypothetical protein